MDSDIDDFFADLLPTDDDRNDRFNCVDEFDGDQINSSEFSTKEDKDGNEISFFDDDIGYADVDLDLPTKKEEDYANRNLLNVTKKKDECSSKANTAKDNQYSQALERFQSNAIQNRSSEVSNTKRTPSDGFEKLDSSERLVQKAFECHWNEVSMPVVRPSSDTKRKRKFPGPAGFLPQLSLSQIPKRSEFKVMSEHSSPATCFLDALEISCSEEEDLTFNQMPWLKAEQELLLKESPLSKFNISWLLNQAKTKQLPKNKMPLLIAAIKCLTVEGTNISIVLKDKTGEISGTVQRELLDEYCSALQTGSVLVLQKVSVFSPTRSRHYLNITTKNVLCFYISLESGVVDTVRLYKDNLKSYLLSIVNSADIVGTRMVKRRFLESSSDKISPTALPLIGTPMSTKNSLSERNRFSNPVKRTDLSVPLNKERITTSFQHEVNNHLEIRHNNVDFSWDESDDLDEILGNITEEELLSQVN